MKLIFRYGVFFMLGIVMFYISLSLFKGTNAISVHSLFPDENFYKCVIDGYNLSNYNKYLDGIIEEYNEVSNDAVLTDLQLKSITFLKCDNYKKDSFSLDITGLEMLTNLEELSLSGNSLTSLNISTLKQLRKLFVEVNNLSSLDISKNTLLEELDVSNNKISSINTNNNNRLLKLDLSDNDISTINLSANKQLEELYVANNNLSTISIDGLENLIIFNADNNNIAGSGLSLVENLNLVKFSISNNQLNTFSFGATNVKLEEVDLSFNNLTNLAINGNNSLKTLNVSNNQLTKLDISAFKFIETLIANDNKISLYNLKLSNSLKHIQLSNNMLSGRLDLSSYFNLENLYLLNNGLTTINLDSCKKIKSLDARNNKLTNLNLNNNINLESLFVDYNNLVSLDVSAATNLKKIYAKGNKINMFSVGNNTNLMVLDISDNLLKYIDLSNNVKLVNLDIYGNCFEEEIYIYKGDEHIIGNNIKLPVNLNWGNVTFSSDNIDVADISENGNVLGKNDGISIVQGDLVGKYTNKSVVNVIELTSSKYDISGNVINVGSDNTENVIRSNINYNNNFDLVINVETKKLDVMYGMKKLKSFQLIIDENVTDDGEDEEDIFEILDNSYVVIDNVIANIDIGTTVDEFKNHKINTNNVLNVYNSFGMLVTSGVLKTGYKISDGIVEYTLSVKGDVNGDGVLNSTDIIKVARYILGKDNLKNLYLFSANVDFNDSVNINDIVKLVRYMNNING